MKDCCAPTTTFDTKGTSGMKLALWIALALNAGMFFVEIGASFLAGSVSLQADAIDFLGDAANYGISLFVLNKAISFRAKASLLKSASMLLYGLAILAYALYRAFYGQVPDAPMMTSIGLLAMSVNLFVAFILYRFRDRDSNMQSVWLCTRNDVIGNIAVLLAAGGVFLTVTKWPDLLVASIMGILSIQSSYLVFRSARAELQSTEGTEKAFRGSA